ncbi:MAG: hypothetical protein HQL31_00645 [Planctomycetes bacterium]|nr:hypothetical protein [Planctomycetota bacterium]
MGSIEVERSTLRRFGFLLGGMILGLCALGRVFPERGFWGFISASQSLWLGLALFLIAAAALFPMGLKHVYRGWLRFGGILGYINIRLLLAVIYLIIFSPIALIFRLMGRDQLKLRKVNKDTYWESYDACECTVERYRHLF